MEIEDGYASLRKPGEGAGSADDGMSDSQERVRIGFIDDEGDTEAIWGTPAGEGTYRLEGNPFFAYGVSLHDTVEAKEEDGLLRFVRVVEKSGNRTIRVFAKEGEESTAQFLKKICKLGCRYETMNARMFAVIVPASVDLKTLGDFLRKSDLEWEYVDPTADEVQAYFEAEQKAKEEEQAEKTEETEKAEKAEKAEKKGNDEEEGDDDDDEEDEGDLDVDEVDLPDDEEEEREGSS